MPPKRLSRVAVGSSCCDRITRDRTNQCACAPCRLIQFFGLNTSQRSQDLRCRELRNRTVPDLPCDQVQKPALFADRRRGSAFLFKLINVLVGQPFEGVSGGNLRCVLLTFAKFAGINTAFQNFLCARALFSSRGQRDGRIQAKCQRLALAAEAVVQPPVATGVRLYEQIEAPPSASL